MSREAAAAAASSSSHVISSLARATMSVPGHVADAQVAAELPDEVYDAKTDFVRVMLEGLPEFVEESYIVTQLDRFRRCHRHLNATIANKVMQNYGEFVTGMARVQEFETELQMSQVICANGRRHLGVALELLTKRGLSLIAAYKQKKVYMQVLNQLEQIRTQMSGLRQLSDAITEGDFPTAIDVLVRYRADSHVFKKFHCLTGVNKALQDSTLIEEQMGHALRASVRIFNEEQYRRIVRAYHLLGVSLREKLHDEFLQSVNKTALEAVRSHAMHSIADLSQIESLRNESYEALCARISPEFVQLCLQQVCQLFTDLMHAHYCMTTTTPRSSEESEPFAAVRDKLLNGREALWNDMQWHVATLFTRSQSLRLKLEVFLNVFQSLEMFREIGELFSGAGASHLRGKMSKQCRAFFAAFHSARCDDVLHVVAVELWKRCPTPPGFSAKSFGQYAPEMLEPVRGGSQYANVQEVFEKYRRLGNPFLQRGAGGARKPVLPEKGGAKKPVPATPPASAAASSTAPAPSPPALPSKPSASSIPDDESEEGFEPIQDSKPKPPPRKPGASAPGGGGPAAAASASAPSSGPAASPTDQIVLTNASLGIVRVLGRYVSLMHSLPMIAMDVARGMFQLTEYYIAVVYNFFCKTPTQTQKGLEAVKNMSQRLSALLDKFFTAIIERQATDTISYPQMPGKLAVELSLPHNLFGLPERIVATESLAFFVSVFSFVKPRLLQLVPHADHPQVESFFEGTLDALSEMRCHIYLVLSTMLFNGDQYAATIGAVSYFSDEIQTEPSPFVRQLLGEFQRLTQQLDGIGADVVSKDVRTMLFDYLIVTIMETIVEGFARTKKCNNEGRAQMMLDLTTLQKGLEQLSNIRPLPRLKYVEAYVRAFYLPKDELLEWIRVHQEYTVKQHLALFNAGAGSMLKSRDKQACIKEIEEFYGHAASS